MALAPFRRERAVKKILLVKALPLRVVLLYRTAGWNARLFRKSLCKRLCKSLKTLSSAGGRPFRRSSGAAGGGESGPPRAGDIRHDMAWECRRPAAETRGDRKPCLVSCPLLFPPVNTGNPPSVGTAFPGPPKAALTLSVKSPPPAAPLYRRRVSPLLRVKAACFFCHKKFTPLRVENPRRS